MSWQRSAHVYYCNAVPMCYAVLPMSKSTNCIITAKEHIAVQPTGALCLRCLPCQQVSSLRQLHACRRPQHRLQQPVFVARPQLRQRLVDPLIRAARTRLDAPDLMEHPHRASWADVVA